MKKLMTIIAAIFCMAQLYAANPVSNGDNCK